MENSPMEMEDGSSNHTTQESHLISNSTPSTIHTFATPMTNQTPPPVPSTASQRSRYQEFVPSSKTMKTPYQRPETSFSGVLNSLAPKKIEYDMTKCVIRRVKSDKNYGRLYYWCTENRNFVKFVAPTDITLDMLTTWYESLPLDQKEFWDAVYGDCLNVSKAQACAVTNEPGRPGTTAYQGVPREADSLFGKFTRGISSKPNTINPATAAPFVKPKSLQIKPEHLVDAEDAKSIYGFLNEDVAVERAQNARSFHDYFYLYRNLVFHVAKNETQGPIESFFAQLSRIEAEKYRDEMIAANQN